MDKGGSPKVSRKYVVAIIITIIIIILSIVIVAASYQQTDLIRLDENNEAIVVTEPSRWSNKQLVPMGMGVSSGEIESIPMTFKLLSKKGLRDKNLQYELVSIEDEEGNSYTRFFKITNDTVKDWSILKVLSFDFGLILPDSKEEYDYIAGKSVTMTIRFWFE